MPEHFLFRILDKLDMLITKNDRFLLILLLLSDNCLAWKLFRQVVVLQEPVFGEGLL